MFPSQNCSGFCVFCYQSIYICAKSANSSKSVNNFTKFVGRLTGSNEIEKILKGDDDPEIILNLKLQCCNECTRIIDGFCNYYHQFKVLELQINWKLEQLAGIINHCNRVPSRWTTMKTSLEEIFPDDMEMRIKSQTFIRKYRQTIEKACRQKMLKQQPRVILESNTNLVTNPNITRQLNSQKYNDADINNSITKDNSSSSDMEYDSDLRNSDNEDNVEYPNLRKSTLETSPLTQVKVETSVDPPISEDDDIEFENDHHNNPDDLNFNANTTSLLPTNRQQRYSSRKKRKLDKTNSNNDSSDDNFLPETNSERAVFIESDSNPSEYEDDQPKQLMKRLRVRDKKNNLNELVQCPKCNKSYQNLRLLKVHINSKRCSEYTQMNDDTVNFKCEECDLICKTKVQHWRHRSEDHEITLCVKCGKEFKLRQSLELHLIYHKNPMEWKFECCSCGKKCPTNPKLKKHLKQCNGRKNSNNLIIVPDESSVKKNETKPTTDKVDDTKSDNFYRCGKCRKCFKNYDIFQNHNNSHIEGKFDCGSCPHVETNVLKLSSHEYQKHCVDKTKEQDQQRSNESNTSFCWSCPRCEYKSTGCVDYQLHFAQVHFKLVGPNCQKCGKKFSTYSSLANHIERHKEKKDWKWQCAQCGRKFTTSRLLSRHRLMHTDKQGWKWGCPKCGKKFLSQSKLKIHKRCGGIKTSVDKIERRDENIATLEKLGFSTTSKKCEICDRIFSKFHLQIKHLKMYHGLPGITDKSKHIYCDVDGCTAYFLTERQLDFHREAKHKENPSDKKMGKDKDIEALEKLGFNTKSRRCEICDNVLDSFSKKIKHLKENHDLPGITDKSKHLYCHVDGCTAYFLSKFQLNSHQRTKHEDKSLDKNLANVKDIEALEKLGHSNKSKKCEICDKIFPKFSKKIRHLKQSHGLPGLTDKSKQIYCHVDGCTAYFLAERELIKHRVVKHNYKRDKSKGGGEKCLKCGKDFQSKKHLNNHNRNVHSKVTLPCEHCGKGFSSIHYLNQHLNLHKDSNDWKWECTKCGRKFVSNRNLKVHMNSHP